MSPPAVFVKPFGGCASGSAKYSSTLCTVPRSETSQPLRPPHAFSSRCPIAKSGSPSAVKPPHSSAGGGVWSSPGAQRTMPSKLTPTNDSKPTAEPRRRPVALGCTLAEITEVDCCQTSTCGLLSPLRVRTSLHVSRPKRRKRPGWTASSEQ